MSEKIVELTEKPKKSAVEINKSVENEYTLKSKYFLIICLVETVKLRVENKKLSDELILMESKLRKDIEVMTPQHLDKDSIIIQFEPEVRN